MAVTKKSVGDVLKSGLPATAYVQDWETKRVLESIKTALRLLGGILDGERDDVEVAAAPEVELEQGQGVRIQRRGPNRFRISVTLTQSADGDRINRQGSGGVSLLVELGDVQITSATSGDDLEYDGTRWINRAKTRPWRFVKTSTTGGTVARGLIYVRGLPITSVTNWTNFSTTDLTLSSVTTSIKYWIAITNATGACTWSSGAAFPTSTATTEIRPILSITCSGGVITSWYQHQWIDINHGTPPPGTALGQILHWNTSTNDWSVSVVGALSDNDLLRWDAGNSKWVKVAGNLVPLGLSPASGDIIKWDGTKWIKLTPTTVDCITSLNYSTTTHKFTYGKKTLTVIAATSETTGQDFTGNQFEVES